MGDLLALVNQLLDLAKAESNRLEPRWSRVDIATVFRQLRGTLRPLARPDVALVVVDPVDVAPVITDEVMLAQILRNLLTNGLKFTAAGEVRLEARPAAGRPGVVITVSDTGIGIPPDEQERVFEEFYQVRSSYQPTGAGTGLGLPYARRLTQILGSTLELRSVPGEGTTVAVTMPLTPSDVDVDEQVLIPAELAASSAGPGRLGRVLLVDDDAAFRFRVRQAVGALTDTVDEASDGEEALAVIAEQPPDAIVLDLRMPRMGGLELLAVLAGDQRWRDIPVLIVTAAEVDDIARGGITHAIGVLDKATFTDADLLRALRTIGAVAR
jgi:CheY-like chemotaxis protein